MTVPFEPRGAWTALITPFDSQGVLDAARYKRLVDFQVAEDITGLVVCGTTGESPTLTWEEHEALVRTTVAGAQGKGVVAGTGSNSTAEAIRGTRDARDEGASAALVVDCYYNGPSSSELREEYYERILSAVPDLPLVPYIIPGRTGCALDAGDLAYLHLSSPDRIPAVKQATGDLERMRLDRKLGGKSLAILSGDDDLTIAMMRDPAIAASGCIAVTSNLAPHAMTEMVAAQARGDEARASQLAAQLSPLLKIVGLKVPTLRRLPDGREVEVVDKYRNPLPVKTVMAGLGMIEGLCRPPLGRMSKAGVNLCRSAVRKVWEEAPELLRPIEAAFEVRIAERLANDEAWDALASMS